MSEQRSRTCALALALLALIFIPFSFPAAANASLVRISEILVNAVGSDDGRTFVEIAGPPGEALSGYVLVGVNGGTGDIYLTADLAAFSIPADGVFVVADSSGGTTSVTDADALIASLDPQNGPDSLQLLLAGVVVDAIGYGDFTSAVFSGEGNPVAVPAAGSSLARRFADVDTDDNAADFLVLETPTPGSAPFSGPAAVPEPSSLLLLGSALLPARRRLRTALACAGAPPPSPHA
jgi:hypothetical protein